MAYRLIITEHAEELIDKLILYLMFHLKKYNLLTSPTKSHKSFLAK